MTTKPAASWTEFGAIVGEGNVNPATPDDAIDGVQPQMVIRPGSADQVAGVLSRAHAAGLRVAPRGGGTKTDWGHAPQGVDIVLSTARLNRVVEHAWGDMTATVEAGCTVAQFQQTLAEHGQYLALDPLWPTRATIGGILATNDSGALRLRFGALRDLIIGITMVLPNGAVAKSGGKVVKNVAGYDLPKLMTGALGTLGVITEATFRLYPLAREVRTLSFTSATTESINKIALSIHDSTLAPTSVQVRASADGPPQIDIRFEGITAALEAQTQQLLKLATGAEQVTTTPDTWAAREKLWEGMGPALICKLSVLPTQLGQFCEMVRRIASPPKVKWQVVTQSIGVGLLRLESPEERNLITALETLQAELKKSSGWLIVLRCPSTIKPSLDIWGNQGDALPLMRRVKAQFDPAGILNPGRFVGGI